MECIAGIKTNDLHLLENALTTQHRLNHRGDWLDCEATVTEMTTNAEYLHELCRKIEIFKFPCESHTNQLPEERNFNVKIRTRKDWSQNGVPSTPNLTLNIYTDGSRLKGAQVRRTTYQKLKKKFLIPLEATATVFQLKL